MGVITDIIVSGLDNAAELCLSPSISTKKYFWIETPGLSPIKLAALLSVLAKRKNKKNLLQEFPLVHKRASTGPWMYRVSNYLVKKLAPTKDGDLAEIASEWNKIEDEFDIEGWTDDAILVLLKNLQKASKEALKSEKPLLLRKMS